MDNMYSRKLTAIVHLNHARVVTRRMEADMMITIAENNPEKIRQAKTAIDTDIKEYEEAWNAYKEVAKFAPAAAAKFDGLDKQWSSYKETVAKIAALGVENKNAEAMALYHSDGERELEGLRQKSDEVQKIATDNAEKLHVQNVADMEAAIFSMLIKSLLALVVMLGMSVLVIKAVTNPLYRMMAVCAKLKDGDFRKMEHDVSRADEFGQMENELMDLQNELSNLMRNVHESSEQVAASSEELTASSTQSAKASTQVAESIANATDIVMQQQEAVMKSTESIEKVTASVEQIRTEAEKVADNSASAAEKAIAGSQSIDNSVEQMKSVEKTVDSTAQLVDKLGERSKEIGQIIDTISGIADQTNLLALNAAIEAARAGEHGRGFTVVADEVRKLAEQSAEAAKQIAELIETIQQDTDKAVTAMKQGRGEVIEGTQSVESLRSMFDEIRGIVNEVSGQMHSVSESVRAVYEDTEHITQEVQSIDEHGNRVSSQMQSVSAATEEQSASAEEIASASDSLAGLAQKLNGSIAHFQF